MSAKAELSRVCLAEQLAEKRRTLDPKAEKDRLDAGLVEEYTKFRALESIDQVRPQERIDRLRSEPSNHDVFSSVSPKFCAR